MRYKIREKFWAWGDDFHVTDENDEPVFFVDGQAFSWGDKLSFQDLDGNELAFISQKLLTFMPKYEIYRDGDLFAVSFFYKEIENPIEIIQLSDFSVADFPLFEGPFRVYRNNENQADLIGVELGGAVKNVIAIAAGLLAGLGLGHDPAAALITRGLAEISRLAVKLGARPLTMAGLAGMGDLVLTCTGNLSRNRSVGVGIGQGKKLDQILEELGQVAEGVNTTRSVNDLAAREEVEMPIAQGVYKLLFDDTDPREAVFELMGRKLKAED